VTTAVPDRPRALQLRGRSLDLSAPVVMGILNVTPDSFSDGGRFSCRDAALRQAERMVREGAAVIDIGGESSRPGAEPVSEAEELDRVIPVLEAMAASLDVALSIDTIKPAVMRAACAAGAHWINDIQALRAEGALAAAAETTAAVCLMHMQGQPQTMQQSPHYADPVAEVLAFLDERVRACRRAGIPDDRLVLDPGIGFGKRLDDNLALLAALPRLAVLGFPVLIGVSRKSLFGQLLGLSVDERLNAGLAATAVVVYEGATILRTHDVAPTVQAVAVAKALRDAR
jgi:dihydropteroate synthase